MNQLITRAIVFFLLLTGGGIIPGAAQTYTPEKVPNPKQIPSSYYVSNPDHILSTAAVAELNAMLSYWGG